MKREPISWKNGKYWRPFPCFSIECDNEATQFVRIEFGPALVNLCLCDDCSVENPEAIMKSVKSKQMDAIN
jgi:hypothetical protein